jgi:hypothetical protein
MQSFRTSSLAVLAICAVTASAAHLKQDPLTQLPLPSITDNNILGNSPTEMPSAKICNSQFRGNHYDLSNSTLDSAVAWYAGALKDFRHIHSKDHLNHMFADAQRSLIIVVRGTADGRASAVAYEKFEPGLSEKTLLGFVNNALDCT